MNSDDDHQLQYYHHSQDDERAHREDERTICLLPSALRSEGTKQPGHCYYCMFSR